MLDLAWKHFNFDGQRLTFSLELKNVYPRHSQFLQNKLECVFLPTILALPDICRRG